MHSLLPSSALKSIVIGSAYTSPSSIAVLAALALDAFVAEYLYRKVTGCSLPVYIDCRLRIPGAASQGAA